MDILVRSINLKKTCEYIFKLRKRKDLQMMTERGPGQYWVKLSAVLDFAETKQSTFPYNNESLGR